MKLNNFYIIYTTKTNLILLLFPLDSYQIKPNQLKQQRLKVYNTGSSDFAGQRQQSTKLKLSSRDLNHSSMTMLKTDFIGASTTNTTNTTTAATTDKAALILSTIADLKRNLEHQSFELNGLNDT